MSIVKSVLLGCTLAFATGVAVSLLVLLAINGLTKLTHRLQTDTAARKALLSDANAQSISGEPAGEGSTGAPAIVPAQ